MGELIGKVKFNTKTGKFDEKKLNKLIDNITDYADELSSDIAFYAGIDAGNFAKLLAENYKAYISRNQNSINNPISKFEELQVNSKKVYGIPAIVAQYNKDGFEVSMRGEDIIYQEYGIGDVEEEHPDKLKGWSYGSGPKILRNGGYANANYDEEPPPWYIGGIDSGKIDVHRGVWLAPFGPTYGVGPGRFMFDTLQEYMAGEYDDDSSMFAYEGSEMSQSVSSFNSRNFITRAETKITKGL